MRLMHPFIMTPLTFMYLTRKGTSDIMRSEHTRPYYTQLRQEWPTYCLLFLDPTQFNACRLIVDRAQLPGSISANPGLNFSASFFFFCSKAFSPMIFVIPFRESNHQIVDKNNLTEIAFKAFIFKFKFCSIPGFSLNLTLNNPALVESPRLFSFDVIR